MSTSSRSIRPIAHALVLAGVLAAATVGCSFSFGSQSPEDAGEELIEGDLSELLGFDVTDAECDAPAENEPGEEFACTATAPDGATVTFDGIVESDDEIYVAASNVILADEMTAVEEEAASVLGPEVGAEIDPADVDCPDDTTVLDEDQLRCEVIDAATGDRYELTATLTEFVPREGFEDRFYEIGAVIE